MYSLIWFRSVLMRKSLIISILLIFVGFIQAFAGIVRKDTLDTQSKIRHHKKKIERTVVQDSLDNELFFPRLEEDSIRTAVWMQKIKNFSSRRRLTHDLYKALFRFPKKKVKKQTSVGNNGLGPG